MTTYYYIQDSNLPLKCTVTGSAPNQVLTVTSASSVTLYSEKECENVVGSPPSFTSTVEVVDVPDSSPTLQCTVSVTASESTSGWTYQVRRAGEDPASSFTVGGDDVDEDVHFTVIAEPDELMRERLAAERLGPFRLELDGDPIIRVASSVSGAPPGLIPPGG